MQNHKFKSHEVKPYLILTYSIFVGITIALCLLWWFHMQSNILQFYAVADETSEKIRLARTMQTAVLNRIASFHRAYIVDDPFLRDDYRMKFIDYGGEYRVARDRLLEFGRDAEEQAIQDRINIAVETAMTYTNQAMEYAIDEAEPEIFLPTAIAAEEAQAVLLARLNELVEYETQRSLERRSRSMDQIKLFRQTLLLSSLAMVGISLLIAVSVGRLIIRRSETTYRLAQKDPLTALPNRRAFDIALENAVDDAGERSTTHCLLYLDLNKFKPINDTCGHTEGDRLLKDLAANWTQLLRHDDLLARLGGDEFGLLLYNTSMHQSRLIADKIVQSTESHAFTCCHRDFQLGVSIGIAEINETSPSARSVLELADKNCYAAKNDGKLSVMGTMHAI